MSSRHGETSLCVRLDDRLRPGELFTTFHTAAINRLTGRGRDPITHTPEYKVTAVRLTRV